MDTGKWDEPISDEGTEINTIINGYAAKQLTVINTGTARIFAKINSTKTGVTQAAWAGEGAVPIQPKGSMTWKASAITNVCIATASGENSTIDWAAVLEADADSVRVPVTPKSKHNPRP